MGYDVSYHPISPEQMAEWYVKSLESDAHAAAVCDRVGMHELYKTKFMSYLPTFRENNPELKTFDKSHGYFIAITQGFFGRFHYVRGAMLSSVSAIAPYTAPWSDVLPGFAGSAAANNRIGENYSSGVYIPPAKVAELLVDLQANAALRAEVGEFFPGEHLSILITALREAEQASLGLLEATEVIEPNPLDLESTHCRANLFNCDTAGPLLYQKTAQAQFADLGLGDAIANGQVERVQMRFNPETGELIESTPPTRTGPETFPRPEPQKDRRLLQPIPAFAVTSTT